MIDVWVRVTGAKYVEKNVVGHDFLGQDDGNRYYMACDLFKLFYHLIFGIHNISIVNTSTNEIVEIFN